MRLRLARIAVVVVNDGRGDHLCGVVGQITTGPRQSGPTTDNNLKQSKSLDFFFTFSHQRHGRHPNSRTNPTM